jgi:hypothetical protein
MNVLDYERAFHLGWRAGTGAMAQPSYFDPLPEPVADVGAAFQLGYRWGVRRREEYTYTPPWYERPETMAAVKGKRA